MNKAEFIRQLESLLQSISEQERQEALQYYNDYFNDAGLENEQTVIEALGNPARVAENIKRDLYGAGYDDSYETRKPVTGRELADRVYASDRQTDAEQMDGNYASNYQNDSSGKKGLSGGMIALIVVLCILASPVLLGLAGGTVGLAAGVLGVLVGVIVAWFCLILGFGIAALACLIVGVVLAVFGVIGMGIHPLSGVGIIGGGLLTAGIGVLFMMLTVAMAGIATPAICRGIGRLFIGKKKA